MVGLIDPFWLRLLIGLAGSTVVALLAYRINALSATGAFAAAIMGTSLVTAGGPEWIALLMLFFISATFWSKWKRKHKSKAAAEQKYEKSGRRDAGQVWANGGLGMILCTGSSLFPSDLWFWAYTGVMAAVNADTWATEIGALSKSLPRSILSGKRVEPGTSGGVTLLGSLAALAGAALIGAGAYIFDQPIWIVALAASAGFIGAYIDSLLGATVQVMYRCKVCGTETERSVHCQVPADTYRGLSFMNNDIVNIVSSFCAGAVAIMLALLIFA